MVQPALPGDALEPIRPEPPRRRSISGAALAALALGLAKFKSVFAVVKMLPAGKLLLTSGSMIAAIVAQSWRSGWLFGAGFVFLILLHELGHGYAMKQRGVQAGWPVFIPFFGAMIAMKGELRDRDVEAHIAYGGPLAGAAASLATAAAGLMLESRLLIALAYSGFFLNLFNLTPMSPLDGGRISQAFSRRAWMVGMAIIGVMLLFTHSAPLYLIAFLGVMRLFRSGGEDERETLTPEQQRAWAARYFGLAAFLTAGFYFTSRLLHSLGPANG